MTGQARAWPCFEKLAATGNSNILVAETGDCMLGRMSTPGPQENMERGFPDDPQRDTFRLIGIALWRERRHTEKLLDGLRGAINTEIGLLQERVLAKLENIDTCVSLVAGELARRSSDPPASDAGS
jgi:hypothetical protein